MIASSGIADLGADFCLDCDLFIYGLGFEARSITLSHHVASGARIYALRMPPEKIHSYKKNLFYATKEKHNIIEDIQYFIDVTVADLFRDNKRNGLNIYFDISSVNRPIMFSVLLKISKLVDVKDQLNIVYCPAAYAEPDWAFPQIEGVGPVTPDFASYDADPLSPLCLVLGLGFEPGVSMGIISQLEPAKAYCFWGGGVDDRFDDAVKRANFGFEFGSYNTQAVKYSVVNPKAALQLLEGLVYGLCDDFHVVLVPMGPKIFSFITALVGLSYPGRVAIWRIQQKRTYPADAQPGGMVVWAQLNTALLLEATDRRRVSMDISKD